MPARKRYKAMVSTAHPIATGIGIDVLESGGNCVDAAVAVAAALNVVDMSNTGIGGDAFALVFFKNENRVIGLNASGRSPFSATIKEYRKRGIFRIPERGPMTVTTPGALSGWEMLHEHYGTIPFRELLQPAIELAKQGFEINQAISILIALSIDVIRRFPATANIYLKSDGTPPMPGDILRQTALGESLELAAEKGAAAMYGGELGKRIAEFHNECGGLLTEKDFLEHQAHWIEPIHTDYRGCKVFTTPPNSQGMTLLQMLNIMEGYDIESIRGNPAALMHFQIEAKKMGFIDRDRFISDPDFYEAPVTDLLSKEYAATQRSHINPDRTIEVVNTDTSFESGDTTYFCIVDAEGNSISFINSLFHSFGSGMVAGNTGVILQNRGLSFSLDPDHPNSLQPHKRPMHTLVPCMVFKGSEPFLIIGCIGGDQQPQGLLQILMNIIDLEMSPQQAIDAPRWRSYENRKLALETLVDPKISKSMSARGHVLTDDVDFFGGSQCIMFDKDRGLLGGSDPRLAGCWQGLT